MLLKVPMNNFLNRLILSNLFGKYAMILSNISLTTANKIENRTVNNKR